jgi:uncharacterized protein (DUF1800 family)
LYRRAAFGLPIAELRDAEVRGASAELQTLLAAVVQEAAVAADPWDDEQLPIEPNVYEATVHAIGTWVETMVAGASPLVDRVAWMWHGHFVSALDKVRIARAMVEQVRLFRRAGLGPFRELLRSVTIDPAMLIYLDLRTSTGEQPNENYARELLELFALGEGNYTEADVKAGAAALTGWGLTEDGAQFRPRQHDDTPQTYLGVEGVHDLDTVVDAVAGHEAMPRWIASRVARELLGSSAATDELAEVFTASDFSVAALVEAAIARGLAGEWEPIVLAPLPWYVIARRVTGATPDRLAAARRLQAAGQLPLFPPNVAGWPGGPAWFTASSLVARANLAAVVAASTPDGEVLAAAHGDVQDLADVLGLPSTGFGEASAEALTAAAAGSERLALALITPEFVIS